MITYETSLIISIEPHYLIHHNYFTIDITNPTENLYLRQDCCLVFYIDDEVFISFSVIDISILERSTFLLPA
ncbi:unnamed protein product [Gordionus sp. m RMFG-2023]